LPSSLSAHTTVSIPVLDAFQLLLTPFNSTPTFACMERPSATEAGRLGVGRGLAFVWHGKQYLGACHGTAGIALTLMQCEKVLGWAAPGGCWGRAGIGTGDGDGDGDGDGAPPRALDAFHPSPSKPSKPTTTPTGPGPPPWSRVRDALSSLTSKQLHDGNLPSSASSAAPSKLVQWCHGAGGFAPVLAHAISHPGPCVAPARAYHSPLCKTAEVVWRRGVLRKGCGLCHGVAGNGYAFLSVYRVTKDARSLARAKRFARYCAKHAVESSRDADRPSSLFEGLAGVVVFLADTLAPETSWFPGFELPPPG
jgi:hypothetical protein